MATKTDTYRIHQLKIQDFLRVECLQIDADGKNVIITGKNGSGKSSSVDAIFAALGEKPSREMPEPINRGKKKASVKLDLGEYIVEKTWTESGSKLVVTAADGSKINRAAELLDGLLGKYALDPGAFIVRRGQDQIDDILSIANVSPPVARVQEITGETHEAKPGESANGYLTRLSADEVGTYYVVRRQAHREAEQKMHALQEQQETLASLGGPLQADEQLQSASEILTAIDSLSQQAEKRRALIDAASQAKEKHREALDLMDELAGDVVKEQDVCEGLEAQIAGLQKQLAERREGIATLRQRIDKGQAFTMDAGAKFSAAARAADAATDPAPLILDRRQALAGLEANNKALGKRRLAQEQMEALLQESEAAKARHATYDSVLEQLRHLRAHLLDGVDLGVDGLEIGDGELRLNGVTFRQASQAEKIRVACAVAMAQRPKLRLLRVDEGERLDTESRAILFRLAEENDFQVFLTSVSDTEELKVEIVDA